MKKTFLALAVLSAFGSAAHAQSTVTLYGAVDVGVARVDHGSAGSLTSLTPGAVNTSRFGLRGFEDLGGGLKAGFHLESQINPDVGTAGVAGAAGAPTILFNRRSTVSLLGGWGELRLGRDYNPSSRNTYLFEPYIGTSFGTVLNFTLGQTAALGAPAAPGRAAVAGSGATTLLRTNNAVAYFTPNIGGFYGEAMWAPSEGVAGNQYVSARVGYAAGPLDVSYAFGRTKTATADPFEQQNIGVSYNFGVAKVTGLLNEHEWGVRTQRTASLGVAVPVGRGEIRALYAVNQHSGGPAGSGLADGDDSKLASVGYLHHLSKRTSLYGIYGRINNSGSARLTVDTTAPAGMLPGESSSGLQLGMVHRF